MSWAEIDSENEDLAFKLNKKMEQVKKFSSQITKLEIELVKSKQDLGEAMNTVNEYEDMYTDAINGDKGLITKMESNMTFREGAPTN